MLQLLTDGLFVVRTFNFRRIMLPTPDAPLPRCERVFARPHPSATPIERNWQSRIEAIDRSARVVRTARPRRSASSADRQAPDLAAWWSSPSTTFLAPLATNLSGAKSPAPKPPIFRGTPGFFIHLECLFDVPAMRPGITKRHAFLSKGRNSRSLRAPFEQPPQFWPAGI
jgi:hypothetical protein